MLLVVVPDLSCRRAEQHGTSVACRGLHSSWSPGRCLYLCNGIQWHHCRVSSCVWPRHSPGTQDGTASYDAAAHMTDPAVTRLIYRLLALCIDVRPSHVPEHEWQAHTSVSSYEQMHLKPPTMKAIQIARFQTCSGAASASAAGPTATPATTASCCQQTAGPGGCAAGCPWWGTLPPPSSRRLILTACDALCPCQSRQARRQPPDCPHLGGRATQSDGSACAT
jgi:hypothetical protein